MRIFNRIAIVFVLSIFATASRAESAGSSSQSAVSNVVEFTVANLDPDDDDGASNKFRVQLYPSWAPIGVERFQDLTSANFWEEVRIFRNVDNFMSQFGISSDPAVQASWKALGPIQDDAVAASNTRGKVSFATSGANSRTTQLFINTADNAFLDGQGFSPIGEVLPAGDGHGGMEVVDRFYGGYGEDPNQSRITQLGLVYLGAEFPELSYFEKAEFIFESIDIEEEEEEARVNSSNTVVSDNFAEELKEDIDNAYNPDVDINVGEEEEEMGDNSSNKDVIDNYVGNQSVLDDNFEDYANESSTDGLRFTCVALSFAMSFMCRLI